jgi:chorismate mutase
MALTTRERNIAIVVGAAVGLFLLDRVAITPYLEERAELAKSIDEANDKLWDANKLRDRQRELRVVWREMNDGGLKSDVVEAESQMFHALREWTRESGLNFSSS